MPAYDDNSVEGKQIQQQFTPVRAKEYQNIYCNNAMFQMGVFEIGIVFGEISEVDQKLKTAVVEQKVRVVMAPLHARLLATALIQQLKIYEANFGEIKIPQGLLMPNPSE